MPKMTKASVWLVRLSSATTAPTTPSSTRALRSSKSASGSRREARRGCHAIANAQPTARARLRKSRRMNEGWANCSRLWPIDIHESPFDSIPPVAAALAISSAGLAPNAAEDKKPKEAITIMILAKRSARPRRRLEQQRCASFTQVELTGIFCFRVRPSRKIRFEVFIFAGVIVSLAVKVCQSPGRARLSRSMLLRDSPLRQDKLSYLIHWHRLTLVLYELQILSRPACSVGVDLASFYRQGLSSRAGTRLIWIDSG